MNADAARQDQLIKRIRKLLALSRNNSNPHEAGQALSRAQALMRKHGITELDTDISVIKTSSSKGPRQKRKSSGMDGAPYACCCRGIRMPYIPGLAYHNRKVLAAGCHILWLWGAPGCGGVCL